MLTRRTLCLVMVSFHSIMNLKYSLLRKGHDSLWCSICDHNQPKECQERTNARSNNNSTPESRCNKQNKRRTPASLKIQYLKRYNLIGLRGKKSRNLNRARSTPLTFSFFPSHLSFITISFVKGILYKNEKMARFATQIIQKM